MNDAVHKAKPKVDVDKYGPQIQVLIRKRAARARRGREGARGRPPSRRRSRSRTPSSCPRARSSRPRGPGTGAQPEAADRVKVHYEGQPHRRHRVRQLDKRSEPAVFPLGGVIKCWTEGVGHMKIGEKAKLTCPSDTAYGDGGRPPVIPGGATLIFDVELLDVMKAPSPPPPA